MKYIKFKISGRILYGEFVKKYRDYLASANKFDNEDRYVIRLKKELRGFLFLADKVFLTKDYFNKDSIIIDFPFTLAQGLEEVSEEEYMAAMVMES